MLLKLIVKELWQTGRTTMHHFCIGWGSGVKRWPEATTVRDEFCPLSTCKTWLQLEGEAAGQTVPTLGRWRNSLYVLSMHLELTPGHCSSPPSAHRTSDAPILQKAVIMMPLGPSASCLDHCVNFLTTFSLPPSFSSIYSLHEQWLSCRKLRIYCILD